MLALKREWMRIQGMRLWLVRKTPARAIPRKVRGMRVGAWRWTAPKARAESHWACWMGRRWASHGKRGATKKDFFPDGGDDEGIGEEREKSLGVSGFEEAGHGGLGFERKTEKEKRGGAEDEEKKDGKKKSEDGTKGEEKIGEGIGAVQTPEWDRFFLGEREKREPDEKSAGGKEGRSEPRGEGEGGDAEKEQGRWNGQGGKGGGRGGGEKRSCNRAMPPQKRKVRARASQRAP